MQIACLPNSYGRFGPLAALPFLAEAGIRFIEMPIKTHGTPSFFGETPALTNASTHEGVARVREALHESGIQACSCNISSGNPLDPRVVDLTRRKLDLAAELSVPLVVAGAGEAADDAERHTLMDHLRVIGDHAHGLGITYCCETHPGVCQCAEGMLQTMSELGHPAVRLNFDTGNIIYYNEGADVIASLRQVIDHVRHVHLKDTPGGFRQWHFTELGSGVVDFRAILAILQDAGYTGPLSLEIEGIEGEPPLTLAEHHRRIVDSMAHLRDCGYLG